MFFQEENIMASLDNDAAFDLTNETLKAWKAPQTPVSAPFDPESSTLRAQHFCPDNVLKNIQTAIDRDRYRKQIIPLLKKVKAQDALTISEARGITEIPLQHTSTKERATLLHGLIQGEASPAHIESITYLLAHDGFTTRFSPAEGKLFFSTLCEHGIETLSGLISLAPVPECRELLFEAWLHKRLSDLFETLSHEKQGLIQLRQESSLREKLETVSYVTPEQRMDFIREILSLDISTDIYQSFITDKLDNIFHKLNITERSAILSEQLMSDTRIGVFEILRSATSLDEIRILISEAGIERLTALESSSVNELLATSIFLGEVRAIDFQITVKDFTEQSLSLAHEELRDKFLEVPKLVSNYPAFKNSNVARQLQIAAVDGLIELDEAISSTQKDRDRMLEVLERHSRMAQIEFYYGVDLSTRNSILNLNRHLHDDVCTLQDFGVIPSSEKDGSTPEPISERTDYWQITHIEQVERVLQSIPEGDILFSPLLSRIELVASLGPGVLGARYPDGVIQIADLALNHKGIAEAYENIESLLIVLAHELGHGLQIGEGGSQIHFPGNDHDPTFGQGESVYDFDEWLNLSGWRVYRREQYKPSQNGNTIILDGEELSLNKPVEYNGETIILSYDRWRNILQSYRADSEFSNRWYAKMSPWEDFAEAFSEYIFLPDRLLRDAPEKFLHLELEFKKYEDNQELQRRLRTALAQNPDLTLK